MMRFVRTAQVKRKSREYRSGKKNVFGARAELNEGIRASFSPYTRSLSWITHLLHWNLELGHVCVIRLIDIFTGTYRCEPGLGTSLSENRNP